MSKKEVESVEAAAVPSLLSANMFKADAGKGTSAIEQEDLALPFMKIFSGLEDIPGHRTNLERERGTRCDPGDVQQAFHCLGCAWHRPRCAAGYLLAG